MRNAIRIVSFLAVVALGISALSCVGAPDSKPGPAGLSQAERELMEMEAIYRQIETGDLAGAEPRLAALAAGNPTNRDYPVLRAGVLLSMGRSDEAQNVAAAETLAAPDNIDAWLVLAEIEQYKGNSKGQKDALSAVLALEPANTDALASMGDLYYDQKDYKAAETSYRAAIAAQPQHVDALLGLGRVQYRRDDMKGSLASVEAAMAAEPTDPRVYLDRSRIYYQIGRYEDCAKDLDEAIRLAPTSSWAYLERGKLYMDTGLSQEALADFSKSIELDDTYFLAYVYRASVYEASSQDRLALDDYLKVIKIYPEYWYAFESAGVLAYRLGMFKEAASYFATASGYSSETAEYLVAAGLALLRSGDAKAAKEFAGKQLARIDKEKQPTHWLALRMVYDQLDNAAELELKASAEKSPDVKSALLFYMGSYWLGKGKTDLARIYLTLCMELKGALTIERRMAEADLLALGSK
ncbi:MAG TPA: tetratricopeptide repeat protein [Spirochaetales bacterium]|nr:tetratricopeptide repeat protein [Spirochaetales bacterium]